MIVPGVEEARNLFPRGLSQPDRGFRFSLDALLLTAFAGRSGVRGRVLDLGAGCGVVGMGILLDHPETFVAGVDVNRAMLAHAVENSCRLGVADRFLPVRADVSHIGAVRPESVDLVVCNPPYRDPGTGRMSPHAAKNPARFEGGCVLRDFVGTAAFALRNRKPCAFILLAERADELLETLLACRLRPKDLLFVHPRTDAPARLILVRAIKNGGPGLSVHPPLILHQGQASETRLSPAALAFCPRLACNAEPWLGDEQKKRTPADRQSFGVTRVASNLLGQTSDEVGNDGRGY